MICSSVNRLSASMSIPSEVMDLLHFLGKGLGAQVTA